MLGRRPVVVLKVEPAALERFLVLRYELAFGQVNLSTKVIRSKVCMLF